MLKTRKVASKVIAISSAMILAASVATPAQAATITGSGSTAIKNLLDICIPNYNGKSGHTITYAGGGSGAGRTAFNNGTVDFAMSDATYAATAAQPTGKFVYVPLTQFPLALIVKLDGVTNTLVDLSNLVTDAIEKATHSLLTANLDEAQKVIDADDKVDLTQHDLDARIIDIIARQQPVASDLRALVTALRMAADLERMGDMAHHVAKIARLRHPQGAIPSELLLTIEEMGKVAATISRKSGEVISSRDIEKAVELEKIAQEADGYFSDAPGELRAAFEL